MKVTQKITRQDGSTEETNFIMEMNKGISHVSWTLAPIDEEPMAVRILESGWKDHGEPMFHVLTEWGAYEETSYSHLNFTQLCDTHPEFRGIYENTFQDIVVEGDLVKTVPNDKDLGTLVRQLSIKL